ncbi:CpsD/CapB family tyrosine-protein kinase, partial [Candidatus Saccharibacteria bacterium]|nr:CpsD/CapB family tyrosine-protein kinase [Candidatus Saccharibacteria bacterium]
MEDLIVATNPKSSFAESIKLIKTNITFSSIGTGFKTILMTSPESGDGKSFLVANLASAFAQEGKKVLIIDAD